MWSSNGSTSNMTFEIIINGSEYNTTVRDSFRLSKFIMDFVYPKAKYMTSSLAILSNILVAVTIIKCWKFWRNSTGFLMLMLACNDIIVNTVSILIFTRYGFILNYIYKDVILYLSSIFESTSNFIMMLISLNRYALVCKPFSHFRITSRKSTLIQIITITVILLCVYIFQFNAVLQHVHMYEMGQVIVYGLLSHILPIVVSTVLTILVIQEITNNISVLGESINSGPSRHGGRNITQAMVTANVAFILLSIPYIISFTVLIVVKNYVSDRFPVTIYIVHMFLNLLRDINFSINIFIYTAKIPAFRAALKDLMKCWPKCFSRIPRNPCYHLENTFGCKQETQETSL